MLIASCILHQVKEVGTEVTQKEINSESKTLAYIGIILTRLHLDMVIILHCRKSKFCRRCTFSNTVKIMVFISDVKKLYTYKAMQNSRQYTFYSKLQACQKLKT